MGARLAKRAIALLLALVLILGAAEVLLRLLDPHGISDSFNNERYRLELLEMVGPPRLYRHLSSREVDFRGFRVTTDERGARGPRRDHPKPEGTRRILFLGDSVTFGWGVSDEETFVALLEASLNAASSTPWETVNLGHMGYDTTQELGAYTEVGSLYEPDILVVVFVDNDIVPMELVLAQQVADPLTDPTVSDEAKAFLRMNQRIAKLRPILPYTSAFLAYRYTSSHPAVQVGSKEHADEMGIDIELGWQRSQKGLTHLRDLCRDGGIGFCVLDYYAHQALEDFCTTESIPYRSIAFTPEEWATGLNNSDSDAHANAKGHRILARNVERSLREVGLLE